MFWPDLVRTILKAIRRPAVLLAVAGAPGVFAEEARVVEMKFHSEVLGRDMPYTVVRPADEAAAQGAVLFLLHGRGRTHKSLIESAQAKVALLAAPFYIVMPKGEDGWYINSPVVADARYEDYLLEVMREAGQHAPLSRDPHRRAIAGWSMGGYGAVRFAERHPGEVGAVSSIIGLLDFPSRPVSEQDGYKVPTDRFGDDEKVWGEFNPLRAVDALQGRRVLLVAATGSWDYGMNLRFAAALGTRGIHHEIVGLPGTHDFAVVVAALPKVVDFCTRSFTAEAGRDQMPARP